MIQTGIDPDLSSVNSLKEKKGKSKSPAKKMKEKKGKSKSTPKEKKKKKIKQCNDIQTGTDLDLFPVSSLKEEKGKGKAQKEKQKKLKRCDETQNANVRELSSEITLEKKKAKDKSTLKGDKKKKVKSSEKTHTGKDLELSSQHAFKEKRKHKSTLKENGGKRKKTLKEKENEKANSASNAKKLKSKSTKKLKSKSTKKIKSSHSKMSAMKGQSPVSNLAITSPIRQSLSKTMCSSATSKRRHSSSELLSPRIADADHCNSKKQKKDHRRVPSDSEIAQYTNAMKEVARVTERLKKSKEIQQFLKLPGGKDCDSEGHQVSGGCGNHEESKNSVMNNTLIPEVPVKEGGSDTGKVVVDAKDTLDDPNTTSANEKCNEQNTSEKGIESVPVLVKLTGGASKSKHKRTLNVEKQMACSKQTGSGAKSETNTLKGSSMIVQDSDEKNTEHLVRVSCTANNIPTIDHNPSQSLFTDIESGCETDTGDVVKRTVLEFLSSPDESPLKSSKIPMVPIFSTKAVDDHEDVTDSDLSEGMVEDTNQTILGKDNHSFQQHQLHDGDLDQDVKEDMEGYSVYELKVLDTGSSNDEDAEPCQENGVDDSEDESNRTVKGGSDGDILASNVTTDKVPDPCTSEIRTSQDTLTPRRTKRKIASDDASMISNHSKRTRTSSTDSETSQGITPGQPVPERNIPTSDVTNDRGQVPETESQTSESEMSAVEEEDVLLLQSEDVDHSPDEHNSTEDDVNNCETNQIDDNDDDDNDDDDDDDLAEHRPAESNKQNHCQSIQNGQERPGSVNKDNAELNSDGSGLLDQDLHTPDGVDSASMGDEDMDVLRLENHLKRDQTLIHIYCHADRAAAFMEVFQDLANIDGETLTRQNFKNSPMALIRGKLKQDQSETGRECPGTPPLFEDAVDETASDGNPDPSENEDENEDSQISGNDETRNITDYW